MSENNNNVEQPKPQPANDQQLDQNTIKAIEVAVANLAKRYIDNAPQQSASGVVNPGLDPSFIKSLAESSIQQIKRGVWELNGKKYNRSKLKPVQTVQFMHLQNGKDMNGSDVTKEKIKEFLDLSESGKQMGALLNLDNDDDFELAKQYYCNAGVMKLVFDLSIADFLDVPGEDVVFFLNCNEIMRQGFR